MFAFTRGPTKKCKRCSLRHLSRRNDQCPHCSSLNDAGLSALFEKIERESIAAMALGRKMLIGAALLAFVAIALIAK